MPMAELVSRVCSRDRVVLGGLFVCSAVSLALAAAHLHAGFSIGGDGITYLCPLHNALAGRGYTVMGEPILHGPPLYGVFGWLMWLVVRDVELAGIAANLLASLVVIGLCYRLGRVWGGRAVGLLAAAWVAFSPLHIQMATSTYSEPITTLVLLAAFGLFARLYERGGRSGAYAGLGALLGLACLARGEPQLVALLMWAILLARRPDADAPTPRGARWRDVALSVVVFGVVVYPYARFLHQQTGRWTLHAGVGRVLVKWESVLDEDGEGTRRALPSDVEFRAGEYVRQHLLDLPRRWAANAPRMLLWLVYTSRHVLAGLLVLWLLARLRRGPRVERPPAPPLVAVLVCCSPLAVVPAIAFYERMLAVYLPLIWLAMAPAAVGWARQAARDATRPLALALVLGAVTVAGLLPMTRRLSWVELATKPNGHLGAKAAGEWLLAHGGLPPDATVLSAAKAKIVLFYASGKDPGFGGRPVTIAPEEELAVVVQRLRDTGGWLVLDTGRTFRNPALKALWDDPSTAAADGLELVADGTAEGFRIYRAAGATRLAPAP